MTMLASKEVLRPAKAGLNSWLAQRALALAPTFFAILRCVKPILAFGRTIIMVSRKDDVIEVFANDGLFDTPYKANIDVLTGGEPFSLGMRDTPAYREDLAAMQRVFQTGDLDVMGDRAEAMAKTIVDDADGCLEVVGDLVRKVTFDLYTDYLGIPQPETENIDAWSTRLFEFQFTSSPKDVDLRQQVDSIAPALRAHIDQTIAERKASDTQKDDVLGRCLALQGNGETKFTDIFIRTNLLCMLVGGPPQLPMVTPQALEQLLRRPRALAMAQEAAQSGDDEALWGIVCEAIRFDPLAPALKRVSVANGALAKGRARETQIKAGTTVLVGMASAMMDPRRVHDPKSFDPKRKDHEYIHFGHGLHECFGRFLNRAMLHRILKPLLAQKLIRRASGRDGHLSKRGIFAEKLIVCYK